MKLEIYKKHFVCACHKLEDIPVICSAIYAFILISKPFFMIRAFHPKAYIGAYVSDRPLKVCFWGIIGHPTPGLIKYGLRERVVFAIEALAKNDRKAFLTHKKPIRDQLLPLYMRDLIKDRSLLKHAIQVEPVIAKHFRGHACLTSALIKQLLSLNGRILWFLSDRHKDDEELVLIACRQTGGALRDAHARFLSHKTFVKQALISCPDIYKSLTPLLQKDPDIITHMVYHHPEAYLLINSALLDHLMKLKILNVQGLALRYMSALDQDTPAYAIAAVGHNGLALEFASMRLKRHYTVVTRAYQQNPLSQQFIDDEYKQIVQLYRYRVILSNRENVELRERQRLAMSLVLKNMN